MVKDVEDSSFTLLLTKSMYCILVQIVRTKQEEGMPVPHHLIGHVVGYVVR